MSQAIKIGDRWVYGPPRDPATSRDAYWLAAHELARLATSKAGTHCVTCGGYLWDRAGTGRLYCDETCRARQARRRERFRRFLREAEEPCHFCGVEEPPSGSA